MRRILLTTCRRWPAWGWHFLLVILFLILILDLKVFGRRPEKIFAVFLGGLGLLRGAFVGAGVLRILLLGGSMLRGDAPRMGTLTTACARAIRIPVEVLKMTTTASILPSSTRVEIPSETSPVASIVVVLRGI